MSEDGSLIIEVTPIGKGLILDLGGGTGSLRADLVRLGYEYVNVDVRAFNETEPSVIADAHSLPFRPQTFNAVVSKDTLEHFACPATVITEVWRVLRPAGLFIIWVPFIHPFHGDDFYRYTPLGLRHLLRKFDILLFDSPRRLVAIVGTLFADFLGRRKLALLGGMLLRLCRRVDRELRFHDGRTASFAAGYRLVAKKTEWNGRG